MKKLIVALFFISFSALSSAQTDLFKTLKQLARENHPEINFEDKLVAYNVWNINDAGSRELNRAFEKAAATYESAKLKGGKKGLVVILVNKDNLSPEAMIIVSKDGLSKSVNLKQSEVGEIKPASSNAVFDSEGRMIYQDLAAGDVLNSVHNLITR